MLKRTLLKWRKDFLITINNQSNYSSKSYYVFILYIIIEWNINCYLYPAALHILLGISVLSILP